MIPIPELDWTTLGERLAPVRRPRARRQRLGQVAQARVGRGVLHPVRGRHDDGGAHHASLRRAAGCRHRRRAGCSARSSRWRRSVPIRKAAWPRAHELRLVYLDGTRLLACDYGRAAPPLMQPRPSLNSRASRGASQPLLHARRRPPHRRRLAHHRKWGDGQVSALPDATDPTAFYRALAAKQPQNVLDSRGASD